MRINFDQYFMFIAKMAALRSTCNSRKVGCVIVRDNKILSVGYNGSRHNAFQCSDNDDNYCLRRDTKTKEENKRNICISVHAEQNAICQAAKNGVSINNSIAYTTLSPCNVCLDALFQAGIKKVYYEYLYHSANQKADHILYDQYKSIGILVEQLVIDARIYKYVSIQMCFYTSERKI